MKSVIKDGFPALGALRASCDGLGRFAPLGTALGASHLMGWLWALRTSWDDFDGGGIYVHICMCMCMSYTAVSSCRTAVYWGLEGTFSRIRLRSLSLAVTSSPDGPSNRYDCLST